MMSTHLTPNTDLMGGQISGKHNMSKLTNGSTNMEYSSIVETQNNASELDPAWNNQQSTDARISQDKSLTNQQEQP